MNTLLLLFVGRSTILNEIKQVMEHHGIMVDDRHILLVADLMTSRGKPLGVTRFGLAEMSENVLNLASVSYTCMCTMKRNKLHETTEVNYVTRIVIFSSRKLLIIYLRLGTMDKPIKLTQSPILSSWVLLYPSALDCSNFFKNILFNAIFYVCIYIYTVYVVRSESVRVATVKSAAHRFRRTFT